MLKLNLPAFGHKLKDANGKVWIFDGIRKKYVMLTPEEWVRQHFVNYLVHHLQYPKALIKVESGLSYNQLSKRSDIIVFNRQGKPWMVIECKAFEVNLNEDTVKQVSVYNKTLQTSYIVITNGMKHFCFDVTSAQPKALKEIPEFES
jgi:hypothetical protein